MAILNRGHIFGAILGFVLYYSSILLYHNLMPSLFTFIKRYQDHYSALRKEHELRFEQTSSLRSMNPNPAFPTGNKRSSGTMLQPIIADTSQLARENSNTNLAAINRPVERGSDSQVSKEISVSNVIDSSASSTSDALVSTHSSENAKQCLDMKINYHVAPGSSWGSLSLDLQRVWTQLSCDQVLEDIQSDTPVHSSTSADTDNAQAQAQVKPLSSSSSTSSSSSKTHTTALMRISDDYKEWCEEVKAKYQVLPMKSWGRLPGNMIDTWKSRRCDMVFTVNRMSKRPISSCLSESQTDNKKPSALTAHPNMNQSLPLIAIMAATTTRKVKNPSTNSMALFMYLLPSLIRSLDCGFRYEYVLGYDAGDPFYDSKEGMEQTKKWFQQNVQEPLRGNAIQIALRPVKVNNSLKKPGPVFNEMARAAYRAGATYFYRINDDTEMLNHWPKLFVNALQSLGYPYGVVGPVCRQGNQQILTHDMVHRVHMEIFEMNYYPPQLTDWWMDDWISFVYGSRRTFKSMKSQVIHHTGAHGQRYEVDRSHEHLLGQLIDQGHVKIKTFMLKNNLPEHLVQVFDSSQFHGFVHSDLPEAVYKTSGALR